MPTWDSREHVAFGAMFLAFLVASTHEGSLDWEAARLFQVLYNLTLAVQLSSWSLEYCRFVNWLCTTDCTSRRGLGKWASPLYGMFQIPALSMRWFKVALLVWIASLIVGVYCPGVTPIAFLCACIVESHLFWARHMSGHVGTQVIHTLFCASMMTKGNECAVLLCVQVNLASSYFGSALCKLLTSLCIQSTRRWWASGDSMKFYLFDNMGARPMRGFRQWFRKWLLASGPRAKPVCYMLMSSVFFAELVMPLLMAYCVRLVGFGLLAFHVSVWFLLDIDFLTCWSPTILALMVDHRPLIMPGIVAQVLSDACAAVPVRTSLLVLYTSVQVAVSLSLYDLNPSRRELLPFSAYPMFQEANCLFEDANAMAVLFRAPTAAFMPDPYYLRMQALATGPSANGHFRCWGPRALDEVGQRMLIVALPRKVAQGLASDTAAGLDHERECGVQAGAVRVVCNVDIERAMPQVLRYLGILTAMVPEDAWVPAKMKALMQAYGDVEAVLRQCPRSLATCRELQLPRSSAT